MKTRQTLRVIFPLLSLMLASCGRDDTASTTPSAAREAMPPRKPFDPSPPNLPDEIATGRMPKTMTIVVKVPFGSAHSAPEEIEAFVKEVKLSNLRDGSTLVRAMTAQRTPEGMKAMIELLREYEAKLPDAPPSKEDFMTAVKSIRADVTSLKQDHFYVCFKMAKTLAVELIHFDFPEAREAAEGFRSRTRQKWQGGGEVDAYLEALDWDFKHAYETLKDGGAPWQERKFSD